MKAVAPEEHEIDQHFDLVWYTLNRFCQFALAQEDHDDLFQEGCMAFIGAVRRFDASKGVKFSTFAVRTIMYEIRNYMNRRAQHLNVGSSTIEAMHKIRQKDLQGQRPEDIADEIGCSEEVAGVALRLSDTR